MPQQIESKIQIIIHGTDDSEKIKNSIENIFNLDYNDFQIQNLTGHFENPIIMLTLVTVSYTHLTLPTTPYV